MINEFALITGASKGIGKAMTSQLAKAGYHLLLVARSEAELAQLSKQIKDNYNSEVFYLSADLSADTASLQVADWVRQHTDQLSILINNAGYGLWGDFEQLDLNVQMNMLALNINAVLGLTHHLNSTIEKTKAELHFKPV